MTPEQLTDKFDVYFSEIQRCIDHGCYWSLLHMLVAISRYVAGSKLRTTVQGSGINAGAMRTCRLPPK